MFSQTRVCPVVQPCIPVYVDLFREGAAGMAAHFSRSYVPNLAGQPLRVRVRGKFPGNLFDLKWREITRRGGGILVLYRAVAFTSCWFSLSRL